MYFSILIPLFTFILGVMIGGLMKHKDKSIKEKIDTNPHIGETWILKDSDPWDSGIIIRDIKAGWIKYGFKKYPTSIYTVTLKITELKRFWVKLED